MSDLHVRGGITTVQPPLSQAVGYVVVLVVGVIVAVGMCYDSGKYRIWTLPLTIASHDASHQNLEADYGRR